MKDLTPKQEPVIWSTIVGLVLAAAASYGFGVTDELRELLVYVVPIVAAAIVARQSVTPTGKAEASQDAAYQAGTTAAARDATGTRAGRGGAG